MQEHDNQIFVPPSFIALYADARGRLRESADVVRQRYELCEDLANHLVEHAQTLYHVQAPSEAEVLRRIYAGLADRESGFTTAEATWVLVRLAELLAWPCPVLPTEPDVKAEEL
ncbi:MAG: hypothetical protein WAT33_01915 [Giesbergeria sp.]|jgi:hypothetical protein